VDFNKQITHKQQLNASIAYFLLNKCFASNIISTQCTFLTYSRLPTYCTKVPSFEFLRWCSTTVYSTVNQQ